MALAGRGNMSQGSDPTPVAVPSGTIFSNAMMVADALYPYAQKPIYVDHLATRDGSIDREGIKQNKDVLGSLAKLSDTWNFPKSVLGKANE